jgi:hypothetical protein
MMAGDAVFYCLVVFWNSSLFGVPVTMVHLFELFAHEKYNIALATDDLLIFHPKLKFPFFLLHTFIILLECFNDITPALLPVYRNNFFHFL